MYRYVYVNMYISMYTLKGKVYSLKNEFNVVLHVNVPTLVLSSSTHLLSAPPPHRPPQRSSI